MLGIHTTAAAEDYYLLHDTAEELMMARNHLRLTNQQKEAFNSYPCVEIKYSSFLLIFLPLNEKLKFKLNSRFSFFGKKQFSHFLLLSIYIYIYIYKMSERMIHGLKQINNNNNLEKRSPKRANYSILQ